MKKFIFIPALLFIFSLFSFSKKNTYVSVNNKKIVTCSKPYNLTATKDNCEVVLSWTIDDVSDLIGCSYGGYFNTPEGTVNFSGTTNVWPIRISCPCDATSIRYAVTADFQGCGNLASDPVFIYFP